MIPFGMQIRSLFEDLKRFSSQTKSIQLNLDYPDLDYPDSFSGPNLVMNIY